MQAAVAKLRGAFGPITILVNNAGVTDFTPFEEVTEAGWDFVYRINVLGQIIVTQDPVEAQDNDKKTIDEIKKVRLKEIKGDPNGEKVVTWHFQYTAFLNKSVAGTIKLEFFDGDHYVADRTLEGVNPKNAVISEQVEISEDDGPAKGKKYTLKMVVDGKGGGKDTILASTDLTMN